MVDFNVDLSALVGAALAVTVSSTETFTVSSVVVQVSASDSWLFPGWLKECTQQAELSVHVGRRGAGIIPGTEVLVEGGGGVEHV